MLKIDFEPNMYDNPFFYDGIGQDEWLTENRYWLWFRSMQSKGKAPEKYIPLRNQVEFGLIDRIPAEYKVECLNPDWDAYLYEDKKTESS